MRNVNILAWSARRLPLEVFHLIQENHDDIGLWWLCGISAEKFDNVPLQLLRSLTIDMYIESR